MHVRENPNPVQASVTLSPVAVVAEFLLMAFVANGLIDVLGCLFVGRFPLAGMRDLNTVAVIAELLGVAAKTIFVSGSIAMYLDPILSLMRCRLYGKILWVTCSAVPCGAFFFLMAIHADLHTQAIFISGQTGVTGTVMTKGAF
jgi:hypothetical protein